MPLGCVRAGGRKPRPACAKCRALSLCFPGDSTKSNQGHCRALSEAPRSLRCPKTFSLHPSTFFPLGPRSHALPAPTPHAPRPCSRLRVRTTDFHSCRRDLWKPRGLILHHLINHSFKSVYQVPKAVVLTFLQVSQQRKSGYTLCNWGIPAHAKKYQEIAKPGTYTISCIPTHKVKRIYCFCSLLQAAKFASPP